ncbi:exodeoxyribonuclease III [Streptomyces californicus]
MAGGTDADVICLQEVRAELAQLPEGVGDPEGWHTVHAPAAAKGRAGVSLYSRQAPERVQIGFGGHGAPGAEEFDASGRYVEIDLPGVTVASLYLPSGEVGTERQDEKERFMAAFLPYLQGLKARAAAGRGRPRSSVCGGLEQSPHLGARRPSGSWKANPQELRRSSPRSAPG